MTTLCGKKAVQYSVPGFLRQLILEGSVAKWDEIYVYHIKVMCSIPKENDTALLTRVVK